MNEQTPHSSLRQRLQEVIFGTHTRAGRLFEMALLWIILLSVITVMLESVASVDGRYHKTLRTLEWVFTVLFTIEYLVRIICLERPWRYMSSFYGIIDFLAILPTWLSLFMLNTQFMIVIRFMRLLRIFRLFKLARFVNGATHIVTALRNSMPKITVFFLFVIAMVTVMGAMMYMIESGKNGFTSIPESIYWAILTLTSVGSSDVAPVTTLGKMVASVIMIIGYSILAVPTGIVSAEMTALRYREGTSRTCKGCGHIEYEAEARFCKKCGYAL